MSTASPRLLASFVGALLVLLLLLSSGCGPEASLDGARQMQRDGRFAESLVPLRALLAEGDDDPELHYRYGMALRRTGEPGLAIWSLQKASLHPEWQVAAGVELAAAAVQNHSFPAAIDAATRVLERDPDHLEALHLRGVARLSGRTDSEEALADFERMLELDPEDFPTQAQRIAALLRLERIDEAQAALAALGEKEAESLLDARTRAHLCAAGAVFAFERGAPDEASRRFDACLADFPSHWIVVSEALSFFDGLGMLERGDAVLRAAVERTPEAPVFRTGLAERLGARGRWKEAEALLRAGTELSSQTAVMQSWSELANLYLEQGKNAKAADAYAQALALHPEPSAAERLALADLQALAGRYERAHELANGFEEATYRDLVYARVHLERHEPAEARARLESALRLWPNNPSARYFAARASEQLGDFDRAIDEYRQSIRAGAGATDAGLRLARLHAAEGAPGAALIAVGHHLREHPDDSVALRFALEVAERAGDRQVADGFRAQAGSARRWAQAQAIRAERIGARESAESAVRFLLADARLALADPRHAPALRVLALQLLSAGHADEAQARVEAALAAHPDAAPLLALRGLLREQRGADAALAREAYAQALGRDPTEREALMGMARSAARDDDVDAALAYYARASAVEPGDPLPGRSAARLLVEAGRTDDAEEQLVSHLREHPYDGEAALALARLRAGRGATAEALRPLVAQAERFGAAEGARELLTSLE